MDRAEYRAASFRLREHTVSVPVDGSRRDWFTILRKLMAAGISMAIVARKCNRNPTTVAEWGNGSEPRESDGRIVLALLAKYAPEAYREQEERYRIRLEADTKEEA